MSRVDYSQSIAYENLLGAFINVADCALQATERCTSRTKYWRRRRIPISVHDQRASMPNEEENRMALEMLAVTEDYGGDDMKKRSLIGASQRRMS